MSFANVVLNHHNQFGIDIDTVVERISHNLGELGRIKVQFRYTPVVAGLFLTHTRRGRREYASSGAPTEMIIAHHNGLQAQPKVVCTPSRNLG
jgi:hypothetical protein